MASKVTSVYALASLCAVAGVSAQVQGRVVDAAGGPVSGVEVRARDADQAPVTVSTDSRGRFRVELEPPLTITARKRGFGATTVEIDRPATEVTIALPLSPYADQLVVAAAEDSLGVPPTASVATVSPSDAVVADASITDLVSDLPAVSQNGQGGLLQVFSIRGLSRHRVLTLFDGVRIVSDRRAGSSTSFVDPQLIDGAEVIRGPASTRFGSGALGGMVNLIPVSAGELKVGTSWHSNYDAASASVRWGDDGTSLAAAYRRSGDGKTPDGEALFSRYRHSSFLAGRRWGNERRTNQIRLLGSLGRDIGKVSTDFPQRTTLYQEDHWVGRFTSTGRRHSFSLGAHPGRLETGVREDGFLTTVVNRSADWSAAWNRLAPTAAGSYVVGGDILGRSGVRATESGDATTTTTLDGRQTEASGFATWERRSSRSTWSAGGRWTLLDQGQQRAESRSESAASAYLGWAVDLTGGWDARLHAGSGWRFASLSERFFRGTTGRGRVIGNPDLDPERSWSGEGSLRWTGTRVYVELAAHHTTVADYIERVDAGDIRTFVNLDSGTIAGLELAGSWSRGRRWTLDWGGHVIDGEADGGASLADIPPHRAWLAPSWSRDSWTVRGRLERRFDKDDAASGELPLRAATLAVLRVEYRHRWGKFALTLDNLLDETYRTAADDKLPPAAARSVGLSWRWSPPGEG